MAGAGLTSDLAESIRTDDAARIVEILELHWSFLLRTDGSLLRLALAALPREAFDRHPVIGLVAATFQPVNQRTAAVEAERLSRVLASFDDISDDLVRVSSGLIAVISLRRHGRYREGAEFGRRVAELVDQTFDPFHPEYGPIPAGVHLHVGLNHMLAGDMPMAERYLNAAYTRPSPVENHALDAAGKLAFLYALEGESDLAQSWIHQAEQRVAGASDWIWRPHEQGALEAARALLALDRLDWTSYHRYNQSSARLRPTENWTWVLYIRARAALFLGNQRMAIERMRQHREEFPFSFTSGGLPSILFDTAEADLRMSLGEFDAAEKLIQGFSDHPREKVTAARLRLLTRKPAEAAALIDESTWPAITSRRDRLARLLLSATAQLRLRPRNVDRGRLIRRAAAEFAGQVEPWLFVLSLMDQDVIEMIQQYAPEAGELVDTLRKLDLDHPFERSTVKPRLTERERLVLSYLTQNITMSKVAELLHVSPSTVKNQRKSVYRKIGATSRDHAIEIAYRTGLVKPPKSRE